MSERLKTWASTLAAQVDLLPEWNDRTSTAGAERGRVIALIDKAVSSLSDKTCFDLNPSKGYGLTITEEANSATYLVTHNESEADALFAWRQKRKIPLLPVVCNIWDRSLKPAFALRERADVTVILPDIFEAAQAARVPLDFVGQVLSLITRNAAVVGISSPTEARFPAFLSPPPGSASPVEFARRTIGKFFRRQELVESASNGTALIVFHK